MIKDTYQGIPRLVAEDGKVLTDGVAFCSEVYLTEHNVEENWQEVDFSSIPAPQDYTYNELYNAYMILLGGN